MRARISTIGLVAGWVVDVLDAFAVDPDFAAVPEAASVLLAGAQHAVTPSVGKPVAR
jgi:N-acetylmuramic acid 6-phosphate (MurNAc-6-P) etherase